jgi:steroid Delta-isomerase
MPNADDKAQAIADMVNRYIAVLAHGSADDLVGFYADDATLEDPVGGEVHIGSKAIRGFYSSIAAMERECELVSLRVSGNEAAFQFRGNGVRRP